MAGGNYNGGAFSRRYSVAAVVDLLINATGDNIGGKLTFDLSEIAGAPELVVRSAMIVDQAKQSIAADLILFSSNPTLTTFTTNVAQDIDDADMDKICGVISFVAGDYIALNDNSFAFKSGLFVPVPDYRSSGISSLYGCLVTRGTPTYAAATDVKAILGFTAN